MKQCTVLYSAALLIVTIISRVSVAAESVTVLQPLGLASSALDLDTRLSPGLEAHTQWPTASDSDLGFPISVDFESLLVLSFNEVEPDDEPGLFLNELDFGEKGVSLNWGLTVLAIPEPSTWALLGMSGAALALTLGRRRAHG